MDAMARLAKMFKDRNNKYILGPVVGSITNLSPITVQVGDFLTLYEDKLIFAESLKPRLVVNDEVMVNPSIDHQTYFIVAKVER